MGGNCILTLSYSPNFSSSQFSLKKILPIKKNDAEMLTRDDIQFDLLDAIFKDSTKAFTDPTGKITKLTFSELYIGALHQSSRCSKVLKDKMKETPAFATELAKISLLANVGRINTTMACAYPKLMTFASYLTASHKIVFPEMKTALRTYHPVPSLQKTDGNLQDAPRIKNCLKAALLPSEQRDGPPTSLAEVLDRLVRLPLTFSSVDRKPSCQQRGGRRPPTSIVSLIFVMSNQTTVSSMAAVPQFKRTPK